MKRYRVILSGIILLLLSGLLVTSVAANEQPDVRRWFPESGHWLEGDYLQYYESIPLAETVFGYPITEQIIDPFTGNTVQYFERARFETNLNSNSPDKVVLTNLGTLLYTPGIAHEINYSSSACSSFPAGDERVELCYSFLTFYEQNSGSTLLGRPISNLELEFGRIVQYFEKVKLEWHPEFAPGSRIVISDLSRQHLDLHSGNEGRIQKESPIQSILSLQADAFITTPVLTNGDEQTVTVIVHNQNGEAVPGAQVQLLIEYPNGTTASGILDPTNDNGVSKFTFMVNSEEHGSAAVQVEASASNHTTYTRTSFRIWW